MGSGASSAASEALQRAELSRYFVGPYLEGKLYTGEQYYHNHFDRLETFLYPAPDGVVDVWRYALDLRDLEVAPEHGEDNLMVLYHYTNELGFENVVNPEQTAAELFASLVDSRAHFGKGVYCTQHEPAVWGARARVLLNNYSNGSPLRDLGDEESERVVREWGDPNPQGHRARFCIPVIAPRAAAYNIFERQTPDIAGKLVADPVTGEERPIALGEDYKGRPVDRDRDVWVLQVTDASGTVQNASSGAEDLLRLLKLRLQGLRKSKGDTDWETLDCMFELADRLEARGEFREAERLYKECLKGRRKECAEDAKASQVANNLSILLLRQDRLDEAEPLVRECLAGCRAQYGDADARTLVSIGNLATLLEKQNKLKEAEPLVREALAGHRALFGDDHQSTQESVRNLGVTLHTAERFKEAEPLLREFLTYCRTKLGHMHPMTLQGLNNLACVVNDLGDLKEAEDLWRECISGCRAKLGDDHPETLVVLRSLGVFLQKQDRREEAEPLFREGLKSSRTKLGDKHPETLKGIHHLATVLEEMQQWDEAERLRRKEVELSQAMYGARHERTEKAKRRLGECQKDRRMSIPRGFLEPQVVAEVRAARAARAEARRKSSPGPSPRPKAGPRSRGR